MINAAAQTDSEKSDIEVVPNPGRRKANTWMHPLSKSNKVFDEDNESYL